MNLEAIERIFQAARVLEHDERAAYIARECGSDHLLRAEVEELLHYDAQPHGIFRTPTPIAGSGSGSSGPTTTNAPLPQRIGRYKVLDVLGAGGMGVVYLAEQDQPRRQVALKVLGPGFASARSLKRFELEAQILGLLKHPGIAAIYEAGTSGDGVDEKPFFAMELISGENIVRFADARRLTTEERLSLFAKVCDAVHHAHQKGVIHRDLKPANILVDDDGEPRILDFGVARATDADLGATLQTQAGELIGTVTHMSPEQLTSSIDEIDVRSDVYALGVLLYELLAGRHPHDIGDKSIPEAITTIRDQDPTPLGSVHGSLRGDLETIVAKSLEKEKVRRYPSASGLANDVRRFLRHEPIAARPASAGYRLRKFARRNKALVAGVVVAYLVLIAGVILVNEERRNTEWSSYVANIAAAEAALGENRAQDAARYLQACPERLRAWEWRHLRGRTDRSLITLSGHDPYAKTKDIAFGPDPDHPVIATCSDDASIRIWNPRTGETLHVLAGPPGEGGHSDFVHTLAFHPDGLLLASASDDGTVGIWNVRTGKRAGALRGHRSYVRSVDWSADGSWLVSGSWDGTVKVWDAATLTERLTLTGHGGRVESVMIGGEDTLILAGGFGRVTLWDARTKQKSGTLICEKYIEGWCSFSSDGTRVAAGTTDGEIFVWDVASLDLVHRWRAHDGEIREVTFAPDGSRLASSSVDRSVKIWDLDSERLLAKLLGFGRIRFRQDGRVLATGAAGGNFRLWDPTRDDVATLHGHPSSVYAVAFHPDGDFVASAGGHSLRPDGSVRVWSLKDGEALPQLYQGDPRFMIREIAYHPRGDQIAIPQPAKLVLWDPRTREERIIATDANPETVSFDPEGGLIAVGLVGHRVAVHDVAARRIAHVIEDSRRPVFSPDGRHIAVITSRRTIAIRSTADMTPIAELAREHDSSQRPVRALAFTPDGRFLAAAYRDDRIILWDVARSEIHWTVAAHADLITSLAFSPDGSRLVSGSEDQTVRLWDVAEGREVSTLHGHSGRVHSVAFSADGRWIASGSMDRTVKLWEADPEEPGARATDR